MDDTDTQAGTAAAVRGQEIVLSDDERQVCEVWSRVMGYHRPTSSYNIGKKAEHRDRKFFVEQPLTNEHNGRADRQ